MLPAASAVLGVRALRTPERTRALVLLGIAVLELLWTALSEAMIGFAIGLRSG